MTISPRRTYGSRIGAHIRAGAASLLATVASVAALVVPPEAMGDTVLATTGCTGAALAFQLMPGESSVTSADCTISFGSNTDVAGLRLYQADLAGTAVTTIDDYASGSWGGTGETFGACLRSVGVGTIADWATPGDAACDPDDLDPWRAVPAVSGSTSTIAHSSASGIASASASLRFGGRVPAGFTAGAYSAPLVVEVLAPNVDPPTNSALPSVTGTTTEASILTTSNGSWTGSPTSYAYQWRRCDSTGANCTDVAGATSSTYALVPADVGATMRSVVTATNSTGSSSVVSAATAVVSGRPPTNSAMPTVTGTAAEGQTLSATTGTWTGTAPITFAHQWRRCDASGANCTDIPSATSTTYVVSAGDVGATIRAVVTATNSCSPGCGSTSAASLATGTVTGSAADPLDFIAGYEVGTLGATGSQARLYGTVTGTPAVSATYRRGGSYGLGITATGAAEHVDASIGNASSAVVRVAVRLASLPAADVELLRVFGASSSFEVAFVQSTGRLRATIDGASATAGPVVTASTWYVVELRANSGATSGTLDWLVNGAAQAQVARTISAGSLTTLRLGSAAAQSMTVGYDDVAVSTTAADWPLGDGVIEARRPDAMGSHVNATSFQEHDATVVDPFSYSRLSEALMTATATYLQQVSGGTGSYLEVLVADTDQAVPINGVRALMAFHSAGSTANAARGELRSGGGALVATPYSGDMSGTALQQSAAMAVPPGSSWDAVTVNGLAFRIGFWDGVGSVPYWDALALEIDVDHVAPTSDTLPTISGTPSEFAYSTASLGTWSGTKPMTFAYQWLGCDSSGAACSDLPGRTSSQYAPQTSDIGRTLRVRVAATNSAGTLSATSAASAVVQAADCSTGPVMNPYAGPTATPSTVNPGAWVYGTTGTWACGPTFTYQHVWSGSTISTARDRKTANGENNTCPSFIVTATTAQGSRTASTVYSVWDGVGGAMC